MVTIRCTKKLMRRLRAADESEVSPPTTLLGDWYANILFSRPQQLVLGSMNDFMYQLVWLLHDRPSIGLVNASLHLAETPWRPIGYQSPDRFTRELLGLKVSGAHGAH